MGVAFAGAPVQLLDHTGVLMAASSADKAPVVIRAADYGYRLYKSTNSFVGFAAGLVGLVSVPIWAVSLFSTHNAQWIEALFICVVALGSVALAIYMQFRFYEERDLGARSKRVSLAMPELVEVMAHIRDAAACAADDGDHARLRNEGMYAAQSIAALFNAITGSACRVVIKQVYAHDGDEDVPAVRDLFRSSSPAGRSNDAPEVDLVSANTDFEEVMKNGLKPWLSQDILEERGYKNSHLTREQLTEESVPYRSVLVVAISGRDKSGQTPIRGFLCVDSQNPGIFEQRPDVAAAIACANAFYSILTWFHSRSQPAQEAAQ